MRDVVRSTALTIASLALTLLLAELALRAFAQGQFIPTVERDLILGWRGRPNLSCVYRRATFGLALPVVQNASGFRDRDRAVPKPHGVKRAICLGDSFTWGWGVGEDSIYTSVLESVLKERGHPVEVLNAGVLGYNTVQSLLYLRARGFAYSPDVVIYQASDNDIGDNLASVPGNVWNHPFAELGENGAVTIGGTPLPHLTPGGWLKYHSARHSRLCFLLKSRLDNLREVRGRQAVAERARLTPAVDDDTVSEPFRLFAALLNAMDDECEAHGARFVTILDFPLTPRQRECLRETCADTEVLSLERYLHTRERQSRASAFIPADGHWSKDGHRWVAECLADSLFGTASLSSAPTQESHQSRTPTVHVQTNER